MRTGARRAPKVVARPTMPRRATTQTSHFAATRTGRGFAGGLLCCPACQGGLPLATPGVAHPTPQSLRRNRAGPVQRFPDQAVATPMRKKTCVRFTGANVPGDGHRLRVGLGLDDLLAAIVAAGTDVVAQVHLSTHRLDTERRLGQKVVSAVHAALRRRFLVLLDSHVVLLLKYFYRSPYAAPQGARTEKSLHLPLAPGRTRSLLRRPPYTDLRDAAARTADTAGPHLRPASSRRAASPPEGLPLPRRPGARAQHRSAPGATPSAAQQVHRRAAGSVGTPAAGCLRRSPPASGDRGRRAPRRCARRSAPRSFSEPAGRRRVAAAINQLRRRALRRAPRGRAHQNDPQPSTLHSVSPSFSAP